MNTILPGLPGHGMGARQPQKQITYIGVGCAVQPGPDGARVLVFQTQDEVIAFPLDAAAARTLGGALLAPGVLVPT